MNNSPNALSQYLNNLASIPAYKSTPQDQQILKNEGLAEYIFQKVTTSEFRRSKSDVELIADIRAKICGRIEQQSPISFSIPFGGYKHWRTWSYPEPEWAEVFNINYMLRYVSPIAAEYQHGVAIHYSYGDSVMDTVSNMPLTEAEQYINKVKDIIAFFQARLHKNISVDCVRINDFYSRAEHLAEFHAHYKDNQENWSKKYSETDRASKLTSARRNLMRRGVEDLTFLDEKQWEERVLASAMWCDAHDSLKLRRAFNKYSQHIQLGNIKGRRLELHVGSCDTSVHQFWVGVGIIENHYARLLQRIISQDKLVALQSETKAKSNEGIQCIAIDSDFLAISKSYGNVWFAENHASK